MICEKTARKYCSEDISLIENYQKAINSNEKWECHHRNGEIYTHQELIDKDLYWNRPASELIFLSKHQHDSLHLTINNMKYKQYQTPWNKGKVGLQTAWNKNKEWDIDTKKKISNTLKGQVAHNKGVSQPKYKWETPSGEIRIMDMANAYKHHPDWKLIDKSF